MLWYTIFVLASATHQVIAFSISDIVSNYAKVSVNNGSQHEYNSTTTNSSITTAAPKTNTTAEDDDEPIEYDDFDDTTEPAKRSSSGYDTDNVMKYVNGFVNLLALMYKFSGTKEPVQREPLHSAVSKAQSQPRNADDSLIDGINQLAEDRFHPTTATKQFKLQQGAYASPVYNPFSQSDSNARPDVNSFSPSDPNTRPMMNTFSPFDSYSNSGKSSYDADASQYMVKNPENPSTMIDQSDMKEKQKVEMIDYMAQNDPVEIHQSYSYEIPQDTMPKKENSGLYYPWLMKKPSKKPEMEENPWMKPEMKPSPVYKPWKNTPVEVSPPEDEDDSPPPPWAMKQKKKPVEIPPPEDEDDSPPPPWAVKQKKKPWLTMKNPVDDEPPADEDELPPWNTGTKPKNSKKKQSPSEDEIYYPWANPHGPPTKLKGPPPLPAEEDPHHPPEDHPYLYYPPDDHHEPDHHDEEDHDLKDEDRESKRPYTYYHLGRKLWYVPLLFSLYFIVYIGALILKSIARHKVEFPEKLWELGDHHHGRMDSRVNDVTQRVYSSIEKAKNKFM